MNIHSSLITGATSGIGAAYARRLAQEGSNLILHGRRAERLEALAQELRRDCGVSVEVILADLALPGGIETLEARIDALPELDLLVNNAGFGVLGPFAERDLSAALGMLKVHVEASLRLTHHALQGMRARRSGAVVCVSSVGAFMPHLTGSAIYNATKACLNTFCQTVHAELRGSGVRIQALCPGFTLTEFHDRPGLEEFSRSSFPSFFWMQAPQVVEASLRGLARDQVICIPGLGNRFLATIGPSALTAWATRFLPKESA